MARYYPTRSVRPTDQELKRQQAEFEAPRGMASSEFLRRYAAGELGDDLAFIRWSGLLRIVSKVGLLELAPGQTPMPCVAKQCIVRSAAPAM